MAKALAARLAQRWNNGPAGQGGEPDICTPQDGTGCYGAGLARYLRREVEVVIEVIRPKMVKFLSIHQSITCLLNVGSFPKGFRWAKQRRCLDRYLM